MGLVVEHMEVEYDEDLAGKGEYNRGVNDCKF